ncbi:hypothetical protein HDU76_012200 [Blyttiomyces sp. JEL0837]|nr:hypothetical protein HDU76_012200 [Blyttiomyces sp. JEL0837]
MHLLYSILSISIIISTTLALPTDFHPLVSNDEFVDLQSKAQFARLAYCSNYTNFPSLNCNSCSGSASTLVDITPILSDDRQIQGFTAADPKTSTIYIAFRGVISNENWIATFDVPFTELNLPNSPSGVKVESGFLDAYIIMRDYTLGNVTALLKKYPGYQIHGVGHSFGCALSSLTITDLALQKVLPPTSLSLTGFGCPRIGSYEYARLLDTNLGLKSVRRVVHSRDLIVHLPPAVGYRHFHDEIWIDVKSNSTFRCLDTDTDIDESKSCANSVPVYEWSWPAHNSYFSHGYHAACSVPTPGQTLGEEYLRYVIYLASD